MEMFNSTILKQLSMAFNSQKNDLITTQPPKYSSSSSPCPTAHIYH
jgi:hypothetical protein